MLVDNGEPLDIWGKLLIKVTLQRNQPGRAKHKTSTYRTHRYTGDGARNEEGMTRWAWERCYKRDCTAGR